MASRGITGILIAAALVAVIGGGWFLSGPRQIAVDTEKRPAWAANNRTYKLVGKEWVEINPYTDKPIEKAPDWAERQHPIERRSAEVRKEPRAVETTPAKPKTAEPAPQAAVVDWPPLWL